MRILDPVFRGYQRLVLRANPDVKRYTRAPLELKASFLASVAISMALCSLYALGVIKETLLLAALLLASNFVCWVKVIDTIFSTISTKKRMDEELPFVVIEAAATSVTGLELLEVLKHTANSRAFQAFRLLGQRLQLLADMLGAHEALNVVKKVASGETRLFLVEYASSTALGTALHFLRDRATDYIKGLGARVERLLSSRASLALVLLVVFGVAPPLVTSMVALYELQPLGGAPQAPEAMILVPITVCAALPVVLALIPDYPIPLRIQVSSGARRAFAALFAAGTVTLVLPLAVLSASPGGTKALTTVGCAVSMALGAPAFVLACWALLTRIDKVAERAANHVRVWRSLANFSDPELDRLTKGPVKPWVVDYVAEALQFFKGLGECNPAVFELFAYFIADVRRALLRYVQLYALLIGASFIVPFLNSAVLGLAGGLEFARNAAFIGYITTVAYGYVASKLTLGKNISTLMPALSALLYVMALPT